MDTPFSYCDIRGWPESFAYVGVSMIERALFTEFIAFDDRPWSYKLLKKSKTLVILGVTGLLLFYLQYLMLFS